MTRWWNEGRYERECAEFDAAQPLARAVWESLQRHRREDALRAACDPIRPAWDDFIEPERAINAITEGGLAIRVKLQIQFPMHFGVAYLP